MSRLSARHRMALRLAGKPSADPRDIRRRLRQALERANERAAAAGERADATQLFGEALAPWQYEQWGRSRRRKGSNAPELTSPEHYALVLHAIVPAHVERFVRRGSYTELLGPPHVAFLNSTPPATITVFARACDPSLSVRVFSPEDWSYSIFWTQYYSFDPDTLVKHEG